MRPGLSDIAYKRSVSFNSFRYSDGNTGLEPTYANQWKAGLEWYLDSGGLLAVSYFWKDIEGVVQNKPIINTVCKCQIAVIWLSQ